MLSGVQPTGVLHLGNYLGAIRQWVANQEEYDNFFCVVDLHATTAPHTPKELTKDTYRTAALYLASGIDPERSRIFVQSHVTAHAELMWLLNCATPMGWLEKMIQYKEKSAKQGANSESVSVGLFDYPVLMAADILLYQTQLVPVGECASQRALRASVLRARACRSAERTRRAHAQRATRRAQRAERSAQSAARRAQSAARSAECSRSAECTRSALRAEHRAHTQRATRSALRAERVPGPLTSVSVPPSTWARLPTLARASASAGEDQRQHLELTRDIARRFNDQYCKTKQRKTFVEPEALIQTSNARVMSLQDGTAKMSKSAGNDMSRINLLDSPDEIARKIKRCKTDSVKGLFYDESRPEATNLLGIYEAMSGQSRAEVEAELDELANWGGFKPRLTEATVAHLQPLQQRYREIITETDYLQQVLRDGQHAADEVASRTLDSAKRAMGFTLPGDTKLPKL